MKIGMLTSGGDCQALNAAMRGVVKSLYNNDENLEIYGFLDGYKGLMYEEYKKLGVEDFSGILTLGGTILGTSRQPFKKMNSPDEDGNNKIKLMRRTYNKLGLECLIVLGGNGTQKTSNLLKKEGLNIICLPKTIDNDIYGTDYAFGFQSAIDVATKTIDQIHTTAVSHSRVFIVEIMGHKVGWVTLMAGISGGADVIIIPEIPYDIDSIVRTIKKREELGKRFTIIALAEGAISKEDKRMTRKDYKDKIKNRKYPSVAYEIADQIGKKIESEVRITVPGHTQRGGSPCPYDRVLATRFGAKAADLIIKKDYGNIVVLKGDKVTKIPIEKSAGKLKSISPNSDIIKEARMIGISFGD